MCTTVNLLDIRINKLCNITSTSLSLIFLQETAENKHDDEEESDDEEDGGSHGDGGSKEVRQV